MPVISLVFGLGLGLLGPAIGFIIVAGSARGRPRTIGLIGFGIAAAIAVVNQLVSRALPSLVLRLNLSLESATIMFTFLTALVGLIPLIILAVAITANRQTQAPTPPAPQSYGYNQPPSAYDQPPMPGP